MKTKLHTTSTYNASRTVETVIWVSAITLLFILFSFTNAFSNTIQFEEEQYVDDIPFDTEMVVNEMMNPEFDFEDEAYIDDIPFNTACVTINCNYNKVISVVFELEEETYINDMPFDSEKVAEWYACNNAVSFDFELNDESYIDDIPFDTFTIANCHYKADATMLYASGM